MAQQPGIVNIRGKEYQTVALRVHNFRESHPTHALLTEILHRDRECVVMRATIVEPSGRVVATGHAEEYRKDGQINATSALENCETSAIGRALAAFGLGGSEFASADEVARAVSGAKPRIDQSAIIPATVGAGDDLTAARRAELDNVALDIIDLAREGRELDCIRAYYSLTDSDEKVYVWKCLASESKLRALIKANSPHRTAE